MTKPRLAKVRALFYVLQQVMKIGYAYFDTASIYCVCVNYRVVSYPGLTLLLRVYATLFDTGFFAGELAQIVKFCTAHFAVFVDGDRVDER